MNFWSKLSKRERFITAGGAVLLLTALLYLVLIAPFRDNLAEMRSSLPTKRSAVISMQGAADQVEMLRNTKPEQQQISPLKLIDITAKRTGINENLKRIDPGEDDRIKVWFEDLAFVDLIGFFRKLDREHGIEVIDLSAEKLDGPGLVNARVTFRVDR